MDGAEAKIGPAKQVRTSLNADQVKLAAQFRLFLLVEDVIAQHKVDGGTVIPQGRMVALLKESDPELDEEYRTERLVIATPGRVDLIAGLPEGVDVIPAPSRGHRVLAIPLGKEAEYLKAALNKADMLRVPA